MTSQLFFQVLGAKMFRSETANQTSCSVSGADCVLSASPLEIFRKKLGQIVTSFLKKSDCKQPFRFQIHTIRLLIATFLIAKRKSMNWTRDSAPLNLLALDRVYPSLAHRRKRSRLFYEEDLWGVFGNFGTWVGRIWGSIQPCSKPLGVKCGGRRYKYACSCNCGG